MVGNNIIALVITMAASLAWLRLVDFFAHRGLIESHLSRKIIHIGTGPLFVLCWLLFTPAPIARWLAALVPLLITVQFLLIGIGVIKDPASVKALSRTGDRREILRGPLYYGVIFVILTVVYWLDSPIGVTALMMVCGGDGLADIIGRRFGARKLPWSERKSWIGSLGFLVGAEALALAILFIFVQMGVFAGPFARFVAPVSAIALAATVVEAFSPADVDNISITAAAVVMGHLLGL